MDKPIVTPGQALLILIKHYQHKEPKHLETLKSLYLTGPTNRDKHSAFISYLNHPILKKYHITYEMKHINNDPTRRYFETHLCFHTIKEKIKDLNIELLQSHLQQLREDLDYSFVQLCDAYFMNQMKQSLPEELTEYVDFFMQIEKGQLFGDLLPDARNKIKCLVLIAFWGVFYAIENDLPLNIYDKGFFAPVSRGIVYKPNQDKVKNHYLGILSATMPLPQYDLAWRTNAFPFTKSADLVTFDKHALWVRNHFGHFVHPFVSSISGTMLCQMRAMLQFQIENIPTFSKSAKDFLSFIQLFTSIMLFGTGGHGLHEYTAFLRLKPVRDAFEDMPDFNTISLRSLFLSKNETAFNTALNETLFYNQRILDKNKVNICIRRANAAKDLNKGTVTVQSVKPISTKRVHYNIMMFNPSNLNTVTTSKLHKSSMLARKPIVALTYYWQQQLERKIQTVLKCYQRHAQKQWFASHRACGKKYTLIQRELHHAASELKNYNFQAAKCTIKTLKAHLQQTYGQYKQWGKPSYAYQLISGLDAFFTRIEATLNRTDVKSTKNPSYI